MTSRRRLHHLCALVCLIATASAAQQYTVKKIIFDGTVPFSQENLQSASGLKPGDILTQDSLVDASKKLIDTGAFDDVQASLNGPVKAVNVIFKVVPAGPSGLLSAGFENFLWWQPDELKAEIAKRVPLFNGTLPEAGNLQDAVHDALIALLKEKQIAAIVTSKILDAAPGRPMRTVDYRIASPEIRIRSFALQGVAPSPQSAAVDKLLAALKNTPYDEGIAGASASGRILAIYHNAGYLDASLANVNRTINTSGADRYDVDFSATLHRGELYHISSIVWAGSSLLSTQEFNAAAKLHPGDLASEETLRATLAILDAAYKQRGFMDVLVDPNPQLDRASHQVTYNVTVTQGEPYTFAAVNTNLPPALAAQFQQSWKLVPGSIYDATYLATFLKANVGQPYLQPYVLSYKVERDPNKHVVTVNLTFLRR
jgi:outer membrane protein insertion porin family